MKAEAREAISSDISQVVHKVLEIMRENTQDVDIVAVAIDALRSISSTLCQKEESALADAVPVLVDCFKAHPERHQTLDVVSILT